MSPKLREGEKKLLWKLNVSLEIKLPHLAVFPEYNLQLMILLVFNKTKIIFDNRIFVSSSKKCI